MEFFVVSLAALVAATLTLFSGFGLGTLLMPVVAIFFPLELAIAITAVVHLANNLFKVVLLGRHAVFSVVLRFGVPALLCAMLGAALLTMLAELPPLLEYQLWGRQLSLTLIKLVVGVLILLFVFVELSPKLAGLQLSSRYLPVGGMLSGFFGGVSGHQGAFRSMFLLKSGLTKEQFVATGVLIAVMVDLSRLTVYSADLIDKATDIDWTLVVAACLAAFAGSFLAARLLRKLTIRAIQVAVSGLLVVIALGLIGGLL